MINKGGEKVYPGEVETFLAKHPAVKEVAVIGVPDQDLGEQVCAWIVANDGLSTSLTAKEVRAFCRKGRILQKMIPRYVFIVRELPKTSSGKIYKPALADLFEVKQRGQHIIDRMDASLER